MSREEYSFVEVVIQTYEPGDREFSDYLNAEWSMFTADLSEVTEEIQEVVEAKRENDANELMALSAGKKSWVINSKGREQDLLVTQPFKAFQFNCFGQGWTEGTASGIEHEMQQMYAEYVFKDSVEELTKIGQQLVDENKAKFHMNTVNWPDYKTVRFVTLWAYQSFEDTYTHEFDSEWYLVGLVKPSRLLIEENIKLIREGKQVLIGIDD